MIISAISAVKYCSQRTFTRALPLAKKTASLIKKETLVVRFRNRPLLGFAFGYNTGNM
jgi:hypothetical protein